MLNAFGRLLISNKFQIVSQQIYLFCPTFRLEQAFHLGRIAPANIP